jgi:hypothetical protein
VYRCEQEQERTKTTRGLPILVARLTAREHKRIIYLCHYFASKLLRFSFESVLATEAFNTKIGLSSGTTIGCCSWYDELTSFVLSENDRLPCDRFGKGWGTDTRIFSPLAVAGLCVTIGRYWYLFKRLTPL